MDTREKLTELVKQGYKKYFNPNWALDFFAVVADHLIANDVVPVVRCKDCKYRGDDANCPMCFEEMIEWDDDGYSEVDWVLHDHTTDDGFCNSGERVDNEID